MEKEKIILKPERKKRSRLNRISGLFADKKKRYLHMFLCILPFLLAGFAVSFVADLVQVKWKPQ